MSIRIDGLAELSRALRQLPTAAGGPILEDAVVAGAAVIGEGIQAGAPVGETGKLLRTSTTVRVTDRSPAYVRADVGPRVPYAHLVEFGHALVRGDRTVGHVPPYPFVRPAFDALRQAAVAKIAERLRKGIEEAFARSGARPAGTARAA